MVNIDKVFAIFYCIIKNEMRYENECKKRL